MSTSEQNAERGRAMLEQTVADILPPELQAVFLAKLNERYPQEVTIESPLFYIIADLHYLHPAIRSEAVVKRVYYPFLRAIFKEINLDTQVGAELLNALAGTSDIKVRRDRE